MRTELPVIKRCCFCLPLRWGLLTWGYIKLILTVFVSCALSVTLYNMVQVMAAYRMGFGIENIIVISVLLLVLLTDGVLITIFIVGGHKKNVKLLRVYYIYSLVQWSLLIALVVIMSCFMLSSLSNREFFSFRNRIMLIDFASSFTHIASQGYFLLLLRSEIIKLRSNCEFRFVNNAAEAECTMKYNEGIVDEENGIEHDVTCPTKDGVNSCCQRIEDAN